MPLCCGRSRALHLRHEATRHRVLAGWQHAGSQSALGQMAASSAQTALARQRPGIHQHLARHVPILFVEAWQRTSTEANTRRLLLHDRLGDFVPYLAATAGTCHYPHHCRCRRPSKRVALLRMACEDQELLSPSPQGSNGALPYLDHAALQPGSVESGHCPHPGRQAHPCLPKPRGVHLGALGQAMW